MSMPASASFFTAASAAGWLVKTAITALLAAGSVLFVLAQNYLQDLLKLGAGAFEGLPLLGQLVSPDRWLLWLGVLFVLSVYHFPTGVVGRLRLLASRQRRVLDPTHGAPRP